MVCFMEMLFLLSPLAHFALSTVDMTCATAVGHDAPTHADLDLSVKYQEVYPFVSHGDEQAGGEFSGSLEQPMGLTQASSHGCGENTTLSEDLLYYSAVPGLQKAPAQHEMSRTPCAMTRPAQSAWIWPPTLAQCEMLRMIPSLTCSPNGSSSGPHACLHDTARFCMSEPCTSDAMPADLCSSAMCLDSALVCFATECAGLAIVPMLDMADAESTPAENPMLADAVVPMLDMADTESQFYQQFYLRAGDGSASSLAAFVACSVAFVALAVYFVMPCCAQTRHEQANATSATCCAGQCSHREVSFGRTAKHKRHTVTVLASYATSWTSFTEWLLCR